MCDSGLDLGPIDKERVGGLGFLIFTAIDCLSNVKDTGLHLVGLVRIPLFVPYSCLSVQQCVCVAAPTHSWVCVSSGRCNCPSGGPFV